MVIRDGELSHLVPVGRIKPLFVLGSVAQLKESFYTLCTRDLGIINGETVLGVLPVMIISCYRKIMALVADQPSGSPWN